MSVPSNSIKVMTKKENSTVLSTNYKGGGKGRDQ